MVQEAGSRAEHCHIVKLNKRDLLDYRAIQRTFDGAYARTALGQLCYAIIILRLFQTSFFYIGESVTRCARVRTGRLSRSAIVTSGLVYAILGVGFVPVAVIRYRMTASNADRYLEMKRFHAAGNTHIAQEYHIAPVETTLPGAVSASSADTVLRKTFTTAGSVVAAATAFVVFVEIALLVLILKV